MSGTRPLSRIKDLDEQLVQMCARREILTCRQLVCRGANELSQLLDIMPGDARALLATVSDRIVQQPVDALQLKQQIASLHLTTGIDEIDRSLRGGIAARSLTEVVGPAGAGKTQFAMMMACRALAQNAVSEHDPEGRPQPGVVYIDTEGAFSAQRAWQITQQLAPAAAHDRLISRIRVFRVTSSEELMALLGQLESIIIEENVKLITLDSAARGARDMAAQGGYLNPLRAHIAECGSTWPVHLAASPRILVLHGMRLMEVTALRMTSSCSQM